jgi:hypothetical protein
VGKEQPWRSPKELTLGRSPASGRSSGPADDLYEEADPSVITAHAWELMRAAQEIEDERHDEDDSDAGGEA